MFSTVLLLSIQQTAKAGPEPPALSAAQAQRFSRDLVQTDSQDFFRQGKKRIEREVQILQRRRQPANTPLLNINKIPTEKDGLPGNSHSSLSE